MDEESLSDKIKNELEEITKRKGYLLKAKKSGDRISLSVIDEFLKYSRGDLQIHKNLLSAILLISNHLINETVTQVFRDLKRKSEESTVLNLYLHLQMSSNFLDGFLLGHSFLKIIEGKNIMGYRNLDVLDIFKKIYLIRMKHRESTLVKMIDKETGLIAHFEKAYEELFLSNSTLLRSMAQENIDRVVRYLVLTFFDGILFAMVLSEKKQQEE